MVCVLNKLGSLDWKIPVGYNMWNLALQVRWMSA